MIFFSLSELLFSGASYPKMCGAQLFILHVSVIPEMLPESMMNNIILAVWSLTFKSYDFFENAIDSLPRKKKISAYILMCKLSHKILFSGPLKPSTDLPLGPQNSGQEPLLKGNGLRPLVQERAKLFPSYLHSSIYHAGCSRCWNEYHAWLTGQ